MSDVRLESMIFENLLNNEEYFRTVMPHLDEAYFEGRVEKTLLKFIKAFAEKHNKPPTHKILSLMAKEYPNFSQDEYGVAKTFIDGLSGREENVGWMLERTEKFCRDKAIFNAIMESIQIMDGNNEALNKDAIPGLLQDALGISFDKSIGHDYFTDAEDRFEYYHRKEDRIPFRLNYFNKITKGGLPRKTLNCALAGVNVGKSLFLCDYASAALSQGFNVLYITLEMAEEKIAERIDCNLLDATLDELARYGKDDFVKGVKGIESKTHGRLIIKEYPTGGAHVGHFRALLEELKMKQDFLPDVIIIDYINICASLKYKSNNFNSYFAIKAIAEELRGLMVEYNAVGLTATQLTRDGYSDTDFDMTDTSESFGLPATLDFLFGIIRTEELDKMNQLMIKQLKSRYNDVNYYKKFLMGINIAKFKLFDVEESAQREVVDAGKTDADIPLFDKSRGTRDFTGISFD